MRCIIVIKSMLFIEILRFIIIFLFLFFFFIFIFFGGGGGGEIEGCWCCLVLSSFL